jgi:hypothetical protein
LARCCPRAVRPVRDMYEQFAREVQQAGFRDVLLLGMGGLEFVSRGADAFLREASRVSDTRCRRGTGPSISKKIGLWAPKHPVTHSLLPELQCRRL